MVLQLPLASSSDPFLKPIQQQQQQQQQQLHNPNPHSLDSAVGIDSTLDMPTAPLPHMQHTLPTVLVTNSTPRSHSRADRSPPCPRPTLHLEQSASLDRSSPKKLRVAVIGSGLAGLTVAHLLSSLHTDSGQGEPGIDVDLFEKAHKLGMDAASLPVPCPCQECARSAGREGGDPNQEHEHIASKMDVPMRSFFPEYHPNLVRLLQSIGVDFHDADNTLSCFDVNLDQREHSQPAAYVQEPYLSSRSYRVISGRTISLPDLPPFSLFNPVPFRRRLLGYFRIAKDFLRILVVSKEYLSKGRMMDIGKHPIEWGNGRLINLREFLEAGGYSHEFSSFFVPLFASVCTCSFERMMEYPACVILEYVARCMPFGRMQFVSAGVQQVTEALSRNINTIHYNTTINKILTPDSETDTDTNTDSEMDTDVNNTDADTDTDTDMGTDHGAEGPIVLIDSHGVRRSYDHIVFATLANQAAEILAGQETEHSLLGPFLSPYGTAYGRNAHEVETEYSRSNPEPTKNLTIESIPTKHPFYKQIRILLKFPSEKTRVVCHTDTSFLPKNPAHWRLLNIAKSSLADVLASPLNKISKELEPEMAMRSRRAKSPRISIFSLRSPSLLSKSRLSQRRGSQPRLRTQFAPSVSSTPLLITSSSSRSRSRSNSNSLQHSSAMTTHIMTSINKKTSSTKRYLQTVNPIIQPRTDSVISSTWFERAVVNPTSMKAVDELHSLMEQQKERWVDRDAKMTEQWQQERERFCEHYDVPSSDRVWFAGSYAYPGIPSLEGSVLSAVQVMERIIEAEPSLKLSASVKSPQDSFLNQCERLRERRQERQEAVLAKTGQDQRGSPLRQSMSSVYFQTAWKDATEDGGDSLEELGAMAPRAWEFYVEVGWMLMLYFMAIAQWMLVIVVESFGGDGSRWAFT